MAPWQRQDFGHIAAQQFPQQISHPAVRLCWASLRSSRKALHGWDATNSSLPPSTFLSLDRSPGREGQQRGMSEQDALERELQRRLDAIKVTHPRFAFDREGRPAAISAVRGALPSMERELFDAVIEDCECELAATREARFQIVAHKRQEQRDHERRLVARDGIEPPTP